MAPSCAVSDAITETKQRRGANEKPYCVKLTSANMKMHYELLPCEKLHYKTHQGLIELKALTRG